MNTPLQVAGTRKVILVAEPVTERSLVATNLALLAIGTLAFLVSATVLAAALVFGLIAGMMRGARLHRRRGGF